MVIATSAAQSVARYRDYTLGTGVAAVVSTSGVREWRLPLPPARGTAGALDTTVLARWEDANALVTLMCGTDAPRFQLVLRP
jgi:hypothetical protein